MKSYRLTNVIDDSRIQRFVLAKSLKDYGDTQMRPQTYQIPIPLLVTKMYGGHQVVSWRQPVAQIDRDSNRDNILASSYHLKTSETYPRQEDTKL